jgi:hypothetical protein
MVKRMCSLLLAIVLCFAAAAQDSTRKVTFKIGAEFWGTYVTHPYNPRIHRSQYLRDIQRYSFDDYDTLKDSPLKHGALYAAVKTTTSLTPGIHVKFDMYGEHRGVSYGMYNKQNVVLYPVFQLQIKDSLNLFHRKFIIDATVGDFLDARLDEGLFIYNMDVQGGVGSVSMGKWKATAQWFGDLTRATSLNIDDVISLSLSRGLGQQNKTRVGLAITGMNLPHERIENHLYYSAFARHSFKQTNVYLQAGIQGDDRGGFYDNRLKTQLAVVAGGNTNLSYGKLTAAATAEARYYGSSINILHNVNYVRFRDPSGDLYANTVGEFLYPLRNYDKPFSQWAVFTEYGGCDVFGATLRGKLNYQVSKKTAAIVEYDINYIAAAENTFYNSGHSKSEIVYSFITAGYYYKPLRNFEAGIIISNKGMNLNLGYPTFSQFLKPYVGYKIRCSI